MTKISDQSLTRRSAFTALGVGALTAAGLSSRAEASPSDAAAANIKICEAVLGCVAGTTCDAKTLADYLADDCVLQFDANQSPVVGKTAGIAAFEGFFATAAHVNTTIHGVHAQGPLVFIRRTDEVSYKLDVPKRTFSLAGVFTVKDGKIHQWIDISAEA